MKVASAEDEKVIEQLSTCCADEPFADGVGAGRSVWQTHDGHAFGAEDLVEAGGELGVSIVEEIAGLEDAVLQLPGQVAGLLGHPLAGGVGGDAGKMDLAAGELYKEEDVQALEPDGLDSEEVAGRHLGCMLADELAPSAMASAARSGWDAPATQDLGHTHVGYLEAEFERLTLDASVAPRWVLLSETQDQLPSLAMASRALPRWASGKGGPLATDQLAVPAEQSLRSGQQGIQARSRQEPAQGGEQQAIPGLPGWLADLALQNAELVTQRQHLSSELGVGLGADQGEVGEIADKLVEEGEEHGGGSCPIDPRPASDPLSTLLRFTP